MRGLSHARGWCGGRNPCVETLRFCSDDVATQAERRRFDWSESYLKEQSTSRTGAGPI